MNSVSVSTTKATTDPVTRTFRYDAEQYTRLALAPILTLLVVLGLQ